MKKALVFAVALAALFVSGSAGAGTRGSADVVLRASGATHVPLGAPFPFKAHVAATSEPLSGDVVFSLTGPDGSSVAFVSKNAVVPPGASTDLDAGVTPAQWFRGTGRYTVTASIAGAQVGKPLAFSVTAAKTTVPVFAMY